MDDVQLLIDLHKLNPRLGPGSERTTRLALELSGLLGRSGLEVADLGCGTGASAITLAEHLDARITAVDLFPEFLDELKRRAASDRRGPKPSRNSERPTTGAHGGEHHGEPAGRAAA